MGRYRVDVAKMAWGKEDTYGAGAATYAKSFGYVEGEVMLPDPTMGLIPFFGVGVSGRRRKTMIRGPQEFTGRIPDILLLHDASRDILEMVFGAGSEDTNLTLAAEEAADASITYAATTLTHVGKDFTAFKGGEYAVFSGISVGYVGAGGGVTVMNVYPTPARAGTAGWNGPIPTSGAAGDGYEVRETDGAAEYVNFVETQMIPSFAISRLYRASQGETNLQVNYLGLKVNRATLSATEGQMLRLTLDEILGQDVIHNIAIPAALPKYSAATVAPSAVFPNEEPYIYSGGTCSFFEYDNTFAQVRSFTLSVDNQLDSARYISQVGGAISRIPYELIEGRRTYLLDVTLDLVDRQFYEHLVREGLNDALTTKTGFDVQLRFEQVAGNILELHLPAPSNPVMLSHAAEEVDGAHDFAATVTNIGCFLTRAGHPYTARAGGESLLQVRASIDCPSCVVRMADA